MANEKQFHLIKEGESVSKDTRVEGDMVVANRTTKVKGLGEVVHTWHLDFSNVAHEDVLKLAARSVIITLQSRFRAQGKAAKPEDWATADFDVQRDIVEAERAKQSDFEKAQKLAGKLTEEEKAELRKLLGEG